MNLLEIYLIVSTIVLMFCGAFWSNRGNLNRAIKVGIYLTGILGGFLALNAIGFVLGVE